MNKDTETLWYNTRMLIDSKIYSNDSEPRAWLISKVNRISPNGICRVTLTQDTFDQHKDYIEHDQFGGIVGMWANYCDSNIEPIPVDIDTPSTLTSSITCSGKPQLKVGGSAKTLTVVFYDENREPTDYQSGEWSYAIDDVDVSDLLTVTTVSDEKIKVKFNGDDTYINKILKVTFTSGDIISTLDLEILPL